MSSGAAVPGWRPFAPAVSGPATWTGASPLPVGTGATRRVSRR